MREWATRLGGLGAVLLIGAVVYVMYAAPGGSDPEATAASRAPAAPSISGTADPVDPRARPMTAAQAAPYLARQVDVRTDAGGVWVTWESVRAPGVAGYLVAVVTPDGRIIERRMLEPRATATVFGAQAAGAQVVCATVTTVVGGGDTLRLAPGDRVCPDHGTPPAPTG